MVTKKNAQVNIFSATCASRRVLELIADQWTALVFYALEEGSTPKRFSQLLAQIDGISKKMLARTLRSLERDGLVKRDVYPMVPPQVEYSLTALGRSLIEPMWALRAWAEQHIEEVGQARAAYDQRVHEPIQEITSALVQLRQTDETWETE